MKPLPQTYDHKEAEKKWQQHWLEHKTYRWEEDQPRDNTYVIDTPPPTVSGVLHMGHIFSYTQADFIARYQRMKGKTVFYPMGYDDNGLPTERLVEKTKKIQAHRYIQEHGREAFIAECQSVVDEALTQFRALFQSVALSVDWEQEYHTISPEVRKLSQMSFLDLFQKGLVERRLEPMLWDPVDQTAIAQAEVEDKELSSHMHYLHFGTEKNASFGSLLPAEEEELDLVIATTRPELLAACVAVMVHPEDERYQHLHGQKAITPVFGVKVPIIADEKVKIDKGTGAVMCCTFGDETDKEWRSTYNLPFREILLKDYARIDDRLIVVNNEVRLGRSENAPILLNDIVDIQLFSNAYSQIAGLKSRTAGRDKVVELLKAAGNHIKSEPIIHSEPCAERSGAPLEIVRTHQWFVKVLDKKEALKARNNACNWHPDFMRVRMEQWIDGLKWDWCISRQRFFGVPFPVWFKIDSETGGLIGEICATPEMLPANPLDITCIPTPYSRMEDFPLADRPHTKGYFYEKNIVYKAYKMDGTVDYLAPEIDVMDTWATSSISPQISSRAITESLAVEYGRHQKLFPADLRPQAHEIIRTWAFYTLVKAHLHEETIPWKNLMISGWCLAADKTKMSKSKGNVVTPVELIEEKGADAVRYWASTSRLGMDTAFSEDLLKIGRKLVNKLWNATNFASQHLSKIATEPTTAVNDVENGVISEVLDRWILTRLHRTVARATEEFERYEYADARATIEDFFWNDFCDNYLELVKGRAYGEVGDARAQQSACVTLHHCLNALLKLFAPFVPHITEELFSHIFEAEYAMVGSLHARGTWPDARTFPLDEDAEKAGADALEILEAIRKFKSEQKVSIKVPLERCDVYAAQAPAHLNLLNEIGADLASASAANARVTVQAAAAPDGAVPSPEGRFHLVLKLQENSEAA